MPAIGQTTGSRYLETEIFVNAIYLKMMGEPLYLENEPEITVRPIRRKDAPHFRRDSKNIFKTRIDTRESDPTHNELIKYLVSGLQRTKLVVSCPTFDEDKTRNPDGQTLHAELPTDQYLWWEDGGACRVPIGGARYIQPDICGRSIRSLFPAAKNRSVIIEVIQTHIPEQETFFSLLDLSKYNFIVLFYFVAPGSRKTQYSQCFVSPSETKIRVSHYLLDGQVFNTGGETLRRERSDDDWYTHLKATYFGTPLRDKKAPPQKSQ
jgi:hypothetical protein